MENAVFKSRGALPRSPIGAGRMMQRRCCGRVTTVTTANGAAQAINNFGVREDLCRTMTSALPFCAFQEFAAA
jgi:hypothetical protein